jgi:hypothetical protein
VDGKFQEQVAVGEAVTESWGWGAGLTGAWSTTTFYQNRPLCRPCYEKERFWQINLRLVALFLLLILGSWSGYNRLLWESTKEMLVGVGKALHLIKETPDWLSPGDWYQVPPRRKPSPTP